VPQHLRALLYDPTHGSASDLVNTVMSAFSNKVAICVINTSQPKVLIDKAIVASDPSEVVDLSTGEKTLRKLAIVETPDLAAVVLTSGTTNNPKPVELTMTGLKSSTQALYQHCGITQQDKWLCALPPNYVAGLAIFGRCFVSDSELVFNSRFEAKIFEESIHDNASTITSLVPHQLQELIDKKIEFGSLRKIIIGGTKIDNKLLEESRSLGLEIFTSYGMTETWGGICIDGQFLNNTQGRIRDGEIEVKSGSVMSGYRHDVLLTQSKFSLDGWFKTGDLGSIENGALKVSGRSDEIINTGGIKVSPESLEGVISQHIPDFDFAICSTKHPKLGESVTLCVPTSQKESISLQNLRADLRELIPSTQLPTRLATIDEIPKTPSGKIKRSVLSRDCQIVSDHFQNETNG